MNLDAYQNAWRTQTPTRHASLGEEMEKLLKVMILSERRKRMLLIACSVNSAIMLFLVVAIQLSRPVVWTEIAPIFLLQLILVIGLVWLLRSRHQQRRALESSIQTIREATEKGLANVKSELRDTRILMWLGCIAIPFFAVQVHLLISAGKMNAQSAVSFGMVLAAVFGVNAAYLWRRRQRVLLPSRVRMEQILASLNDVID